MGYVGARVVHDADAHLMEHPAFLLDHVDPRLRDRLSPLWMRGLAGFATEVIAVMDEAVADDAARAELEAGVLQRKNWWALGAHDPVARSRALDLLGFRSQLVFSTHSSRSLLFPIDVAARPDLPPPPPVVTDPELVDALVRAHNRAMAAFCADDPRLLGVAWARLDDPERALAVAEEAVALDLAAVEVPSAPPEGRSPTHVELEPFYAFLAESGRPLLFHLGSGGEHPPPVFRRDGRPEPYDPGGNLDPLRPLRVVGLAASAETAVAALVLGGVLERHPGLRVGVIEQGAAWVPGFLRRLDLAVDLDRVMRNIAHVPGDLPLRPSEYVRRQVRVTPFTLEPLDWILDQSDPAMYCFSSDYPHSEGDVDPVGRFDAALVGRPAHVVDGFYATNFEDLMGPQLAARLASPAPGPSAPRG
jgi:uncharacterized protein